MSSDPSKYGNSDTTRGPGVEAPENDDPRLLAAVQEYMAALEAGKRPPRQEFLAKHPEIATELAECIEGLAFVRSAAGKMGKSHTAHDAPPAPGLMGDEAQPLGDYKLLREIGRGGMGVVYEATQLSLGRRVAVKVLPFAAALDSRHLQRFKNEAQAAAQLHHTNIVPVYAVGCERSVHFYAMQFIEGQSLADVIAQLKQSGGRIHRDESAANPLDPTVPQPKASDLIAERESSVVRGVSSGRLTLESAASASMPPADNLSTMRSSKRTSYYRYVIKLGLQAAEALEYAHQLGVVHRDIKPANLLLDVRGNLWVTDFGLAQFYADTGLTQTGDLVGTFRYMSPEQASGRAVVLDQRTDIYSLGVTLYELLTLERALPGETREQLLRQIDTMEPRPLRMIDKNIPVELETIFQKATAKEPSERYPTARVFAEDLRRFLDDEPIMARPPSLWDRSVKWTRRHRTVALSALAVLVLATVGFLTSTLLIAREQKKTKTAYELEWQRATEAEEQRQRAEKSFRDARAAVDFFQEVAANRMTELDARQELLEAALVFYQRFLDERGGEPGIRAELERAQAHAAAIRDELAATTDYLRVRERTKLLGARAVREELALSAEQQTALTPVLSELGGPPMREMQEMREMTSQQKREQFTARAMNLEARVNAVLSVMQSDRLKQIWRQLMGVKSFTDSDVNEALALSREQREEIRQVQFATRELGWGPYGGGFRGGGSEMNEEEKRRAKRRAVDTILAQLSIEQNQKWRGLVGAPFEADVRDAFDRGWGRGGPGRGPGGERGGPGGPGGRD